MPNGVSPGYNGARIDMSGAPGADKDWDSLFLNPENPTPPSPQATQGTEPQQAPQAVQQPFLKAGDTVYNSAEDAVNGTIHKDREIARMRSFLKDNGVDPNTFQRTAQQLQVVQQPQTETKTFFDRVSEAATKQDKAGYEAIMDEFFNRRLDPYRGTLAEMNRFKAYQQVSRELPGFKEYYDNGGYQETLEKNPLFKDMNNLGESDPNAAGRLHELYRSAYFYHKGTSPAPIQNAPIATTPTVASRPTLSSSSLTPPAPVANTAGWSEANWRGARSLDNQARKQLIQDGDTKFQNMRFEDVNL